MNQIHVALTDDNLVFSFSSELAGKTDGIIDCNATELYHAVAQIYFYVYT